MIPNNDPPHPKNTNNPEGKIKRINGLERIIEKLL